MLLLDEEQEAAAPTRCPRGHCGGGAAQHPGVTALTAQHKPACHISRNIHQSAQSQKVNIGCFGWAGFLFRAETVKICLKVKLTLSTLGSLIRGN